MRRFQRGCGRTSVARFHFERTFNIFFNPLQPKVFGVKFSLREIGRIFLTKIRSFKLLKCLNYKI